MTTTAHMAWFIGMAVATLAILVVGTLASADLLPRSRRRKHADEHFHAGRTRRHSDRELATADVVSKAASGRETVVLDAMAPLGSSLTAGSQLNAEPAGGTHRNPPDNAAGRAA